MPDRGAPAGLEGLDWPRSLAIVDGDTDLLAHLLRVFVRQFAGTAAHLRNTAEAADWLALSRQCHQLAGAAGALGAARLDAQARAVDLIARSAAGLPLPGDLADRPPVAGTLPLALATDDLAQALEQLIAGSTRWLATLPERRQDPKS